MTNNKDFGYFPDKESKSTFDRFCEDLYQKAVLDNEYVEFSRAENTLRDDERLSKALDDWDPFDIMKPIQELKLEPQSDDRNLSSTIYRLTQITYNTARLNGFWEDGNTSKELAVKLALIGTEVGEAVQELRKEGRSDKFLEELSDIVLRTFDLAGGVDNGSAQRFSDILIAKMFSNLNREHKHGREF